MNEILDKEQINTNRQKEIDFTKMVAIFFLVLVHVVLFIGFKSTNIFEQIIELLSILFGASTFMILMGVGLSYKNATPNKIIKRGGILLLLGYIFNITFSIFPLFIYSAFLGKQPSINEIIFYFLNDDIMQFAGLSLLLFGLLKKIKLNNLSIFLIGLSMSLISSSINPLATASPLLNQLIGLFITSKNGSSLISNFPLMEWFIFVPLGALFGDLLKHIKNKSKFYLMIIIPSLFIFLGYLIPGLIFNLGLFGEDYTKFVHIAPYNALYLFICAILFISTSYFMSLLFKDRFENKIQWLAKHLNAFYIISYFLISISKTIIMMLGFNIQIGLPTYGILIYFFIILIATFFCVYLYSLAKSKVKGTITRKIKQT